ncbi:hypothetical protein [Actinophytocola sp. KF-1]
MRDLLGHGVPAVKDDGFSSCAVKRRRIPVRGLRAAAWAVVAALALFSSVPRHSRARAAPGADEYDSPAAPLM